MFGDAFLFLLYFLVDERPVPFACDFRAILPKKLFKFVSSNKKGIVSLNSFEKNSHFR